MCTFYTVRKGDPEEGTLDPLSETDKFFQKYSEDPDFQSATQELLSLLLNSIGERHGPDSRFFNRHENEVKGFPPKKVKIGDIQFHYPDFSLRLYAMKLREHIVVLFNDGIKDGPDNDSSSLRQRWIEACDYARSIDRALNEADILIDDESWEISMWDNSLPIVLEA